MPLALRSRTLHLALLALVTSACAVGRGGGDGGDGGAREGGADGTAPDASTGPGCGNGRYETGEVCDDGNTVAGDGCSEDCRRIEVDYDCPRAGEACVKVTVCGDGRVEGSETCDDRNTNTGDGCSRECRTEAGWDCPLAGVACHASGCGDGHRVDAEECDDGNSTPGDGCTADCRTEEGYACTAPGMACTRTTCGDRMVAGVEQCDDGNTVLGDGCDPFCKREPRCTDGNCMAVCGDGVLHTGEQCDDGNTRAGDGCAGDCQREEGFTCVNSMPMEPERIAVPVVFRDMRGRDLANGHPDFEQGLGGALETGMLSPRLVNGRPEYALATGGTRSTTGRAAFDQWFSDVTGVNVAVVDRITLERTAPTTYVFDDAEFFPVDGRGWVAMGMEPAREGGHNFNFTSELRYWFEYRGGEQLIFRGDDDVWVFINGHLAVDLGGLHSALDGSVTLDPAAASRFGLRVGGVYEAVVFHAERQTNQSSYRLTFGGFNAPRSTCDWRCGDGIVTRFEVCDDMVNDGGYNGCMPGCQRLGPRCGDGMLQREQGEECDDGNLRNGDGCTAGCRSDVPG